MNPKGVRLACPECTWSCVMTHEGDVPAGVSKVVEGVPYCSNCNLPMKPVASVDTTPRPSPGLGEGLSLAERLEKLREAEQQVDEARVEWAEAKERATACKKAYDADVETLCTLIRRLTSVPPPRPPLLEAMENPACLCGHRQAEHTDANACMHVDDDGGECRCELFELEETSTVDTARAALDIMSRAGAEELRQRLAAAHIVVDVADIAAWSLADYDAVVAYVAALEHDTWVSDRPAVLPGDPASSAHWPTDPPPLPRRRRTKHATVVATAAMEAP